MVEFALCGCLKPAAPVLMEDQSQQSQDNALVFPFFQAASLIPVAFFCCVLGLAVAAPVTGLMLVWLDLETPSSLKVCFPNRQAACADLINILSPRIRSPAAKRRQCGAAWPRQSCQLFSCPDRWCLVIQGGRNSGDTWCEMCCVSQ